MKRKDHYQMRTVRDIGNEQLAPQSNNDHMKVVMEAFSEVVKEYMDKKVGQ
jgi:hypothetical protein